MRGGVKPSSGATSIRRKNIFERFLAFTLAETLIVMGIIGIVSALTLPNLNSSTGEKEKVAKLKKIYQNLNDAVGRSAAIYGPFDETGNAGGNFAQTWGDRLTEFMKVSKNCGISTNQGCFSNGKAVTHFKDIKSSSEDSLDSSNLVYKFVLADGTSVGLWAVIIPVVYVNLDGPNKLPVLGKNTFVFFYESKGYGNYKDEIVTKLSLEDTSDEDLLKNCLSKDGGMGCTDWVIRNENLDYLKADENGKCSNGKVLNFTTNTTCK